MWGSFQQLEDTITAFIWATVYPLGENDLHASERGEPPLSDCHSYSSPSPPLESSSNDAVSEMLFLIQQKTEEPQTM